MSQEFVSTPKPSEIAAQYGFDGTENGTSMADQFEAVQKVGDRFSEGMRIGNMIMSYWLYSEQFYLATHDKLTGLPNRAGFFMAGTMMMRSLADGDSIVAYMADANRLKEINDTQGHAAGDLLLQEVAADLSNATRRGLVARLGGDEFAILSVFSPEKGVHVQQLADWQMDILRGSCNVSVGRSQAYTKKRISDFNDEHKALGHLLSTADVRMYKHKRSQQHSQVRRRD